MISVYLTIFFPLIGFILLTIFNINLSKKMSYIIGISSILGSFISIMYVDIIFYIYSINFINKKLFNWIVLKNFTVNFSILIDSLSLTMLTMVIGIGLVVHIFSCWYIRKKVSIFLSYMNLFIFSMIILVISNNFLFMYLGWEGVGFCSYLLIGFYNEFKNNALSAIKSLLITRVGDVFLIIGILLIYHSFGSLDFKTIQFLLVNNHIVCNNCILNCISVMLMLGAISKSAQIPLHVWLVDAMVGPTPASALIHAATMVTSGVYLISRTYYIFVLAPKILMILGFIGIITLVIASVLALLQVHIKRILAYSTMSQIGYMFLALSVQAWNAAIFHLVMHAVFKALLFLSAASVIKTCKNEQNIFSIGNSCNNLSMISYVSFLVGGCSLASVPIITASFYSKDEILYHVYNMGHVNFLYISLFGVFLSSLYIFRLIFVVFHGNVTISNNKQLNCFHNIPLYILIVLSSAIGAFLVPKLLFFPNVKLLFDYKKIYIEIISSIISMIGILTAYYVWCPGNRRINTILRCLTGFVNLIIKYINFNNLYYIILIYPFITVSNFLRKDPLNFFLKCTIAFLRYVNLQLVNVQTGYLRWYILLVLSNIVTINIFILLYNHNFFFNFVQN